LTTIVLDEYLELLNSIILEFDVLFSLSIDSVICVEFLLELDDGFVSFVQSTGESNHDVSLFK
jgi:hypothetical protein